MPTLKNPPDIKKNLDPIEQMIDYLESQTIDGVSIYTDWERRQNDYKSRKASSPARK